MVLSPSRSVSGQTACTLLLRLLTEKAVQKYKLFVI